MDYVDFTLIRMADPATRASLFDEETLEQMAVAAYGDEAATLTGPYQPVFQEMEIGLSVPSRSTIDGWWNAGTTHNEGRFVLAGIGRDSFVRVDALWRGGIIAQDDPGDREDHRGDLGVAGSIADRRGDHRRAGRVCRLTRSPWRRNGATASSRGSAAPCTSRTPSPTRSSMIGSAAPAPGR